MDFNNCKKIQWRSKRAFEVAISSGLYTAGQTPNLGESLGSAILDHVFHRSIVRLYCRPNADSVVFHQVTNRKDCRKSFIVWHNNLLKT